MVHSNMLKNNWLVKKPVKHWYQSHGSDYGGKPKPIHTRRDQEGVTRDYLLRETPQRLLSWNSRKKSLSPGCKEMLLKRMKEVEAFNASKETREHGEDSRTQKEKRARCYKCKIRGHVYWKCPNKDKEELNWNKDVEQDYVDDEYISWNGSLYALKVNSLSRFLSFMDLLKKDSLVYKNWEIFSRKFVDMLRWFYLVHLNYERLDVIPPRVGVMEINLLSLHKIIGNLGGYMCVTLGDKWKTVAGPQAERPWNECRMPGKEMGESSRIGAKEDPQGMDKGKAGIWETHGALEEGMNQITKFGVKLESNMEEDADEGSMTGSNDFEVIDLELIANAEALNQYNPIFYIKRAKSVIDEARRWEREAQRQLTGSIDGCCSVGINCKPDQQCEKEVDRIKKQFDDCTAFFLR
ncbi:ARID DNA-binding domain-containing protein, partial [Tanacetum coccineum]